MAVNPICQVREGAGPWVATTNGVDVTPGATISIKLGDVTDVTDWYLQVTGTDETTTPPTLTDVNPITHKVTSSSTIVTFTMPAGTGRAVLFSSLVTGTGGPLSTTFAVYALTDGGTRVGSAGEQREGNTSYGWSAIVNPLIRTGAGVVYYNDAAISPPTGANTVQGAIDFLKTSGGGGSFPDPETARQGQIGMVQEALPGIRTPYGAISDGTYLYVSEFSTYGTEGFNGSSIVYKLAPVGDGSVLELVAKVDLAVGAGLGAFDRVRDLGQDATYLYATCTNGANIAIIDKATMAVVGWGWMGAGTTVLSVCADGAGNFYASISGTWVIGKFSTAACLSQPPNTVTYSSSYTATAEPTYVRFGNGYLWASGANLKLAKVNPTGMTLAGTFVPGTGLGEALYALGSIWVPAKGVIDGLYRVDPATMSQQALITFGASTAECVTLGPDNAGNPNARLYVSDANWNFVFVVDPTTDTLEKYYTTLARSLVHVATIGDVVYTMSPFYNGAYADRQGVYYVNHVLGTNGLIAYKQTIEYTAPPKNRVSSGEVGSLAHYAGSYLGAVGASPRVADVSTTCEHSAFDSYWNPDGATRQGPFMWIVRGNSGDIVIFDLYTWSAAYIIPLRQGQGPSSWPDTILLTNKYAWVLDYYPVVAKIDRVTRDVIEYNIKLPTLYQGAGGVGLTWDEANNRVFTAAGSSSDTGTIFAIDETTNAVTRYYFPTITEIGKGLILVGTSLFLFGTTQVWKINTTDWTVGSPITISAGTGRKRVIYAGGYIFAIAQGGTSLFRIDPATMAFTSLVIGTSTYDLAFCNDLPNKIGVALSAVGVQIVTTPTGTMTLGSLWTSSGTGANRTVTYESENGYFWWPHDQSSSPRNCYLRYRYHTGSTTTVSSYSQIFNSTVEWAASGGFTAAGDLTGTSSSQTVVGWRGRLLTTTTPTTGQVYVYNGTQWAPGTPAGGGVLKKEYGMSMGMMASTTLLANGTIIGATYFNPVAWIGSETGKTRKVYFRAILNGSGYLPPTVTAYIHVYDLNGITNASVPRIIPTSTLSTTATTPTYLNVELTTYLGTVTTLGILEAVLYVSDAGGAATCHKAWIDVEWT